MITVRISAILLLLLLFSSVNIYARLVDDNSYAILSKDGNRIFVMLTKIPDGDEAFTLPDNTTVNLRTTFHSSGVFNLITKKPVWLFDWYSREYELQTSDDFSSIVRLNSYALHFPKTWGIMFIHNGKTVKTYSIDTLLTNFRSKHFFPFMTAGYYCVWDEDFNLHGDRLKLKIKERKIYIFYVIPLGYQESYLFDSKTGSILEKHIKNIPLIVAIILATIAFLLISAVFFIKKHGEKNQV